MIWCRSVTVHRYDNVMYNPVPVTGWLLNSRWLYCSIMLVKIKLTSSNVYYFYISRHDMIDIWYIIHCCNLYTCHVLAARKLLPCQNSNKNKILLIHIQQLQVTNFIPIKSVWWGIFHRFFLIMLAWTGLFCLSQQMFPKEFLRIRGLYREIIWWL